MPGRVYWPAAISAPPLIFLLDDPGDDDAFGTSLCSAAAAVVLAMPTGPGSEESIELAALGWAAEHASELGASPRLLLAGACLGGGHAARLDTAARDQGWPALHRQLLVHPMFDAACPIPSRLDGTPPATIVTARERSRYATRLLAAGIEVTELHVRGRSLPGGAELFELVGSLGLSATDELSPDRQSYPT